MRDKLRPLIAALLMFTGTALAPASQQAPSTTPTVISCRVLEAHASEHPAVVAIVFHQGNRADQQRLGILLENLPGETVEMQTSGGNWISVTVARLKSCFGPADYCCCPLTCRRRKTVPPLS